jgi:hypothetical protein
MFEWKSLKLILLANVHYFCLEYAHICIRGASDLSCDTRRGWRGKLHSILGSRILVTYSLENNLAVYSVIDVDIDDVEKMVGAHT